jgi:hypothetical protein
MVACSFCLQATGDVVRGLTVFFLPVLLLIFCFSPEGVPVIIKIGAILPPMPFVFALLGISPTPLAVEA